MSGERRGGIHNVTVSRSSCGCSEGSVGRVITTGAVDVTMGVVSSTLGLQPTIMKQRSKPRMKWVRRSFIRKGDMLAL